MSLDWFDNDSVGQAVAQAKATERPLLVDFWSPTCKGCAKLLKVTYTDAEVERFLTDRFIPVKYNTKKPNEWFKRLNGSFGHFWHPNIVVMDHHLIEMRRFIGYLPPVEFMAALDIGRGLHELYHRRAETAIGIFQSIAEKWGDSRAAPEALYWAGVAAYRVHGGLPALTATWEELARRYPGTDWTTRADCLDVTFAAGGFDVRDETSISLEAPIGAMREGTTNY